MIHSRKLTIAKICCAAADNVRLVILVAILSFDGHTLAQENQHLRHRREDSTHLEFPPSVLGITLKNTILIVILLCSFMRIVTILKRFYAIKQQSIDRRMWMYSDDSSPQVGGSKTDLYLPKNRETYFVPISEGDIEMREKLPPPDSSIVSPAVRFYDDVTVYPIFSRNEYPPDIRSGIWMPAKEIYHNKLRNCREYQYDGWDWQTATEEEDMIVDFKTGELVHPVHTHENSRPWRVFC